MSRMFSTQVTCPVCGQPFLAQLEQILDAGSDPGAKARLLSGRINQVACPHCSNVGMLATPLLYHDPAKELLLLHMPTGLTLPQVERERLIGSLTRQLMSSIPPEGRKGYLFSPKTVLSLEGLVDLVLEAEGIPQEVLEGQRKRSQLLQRLLGASEAELEPMVASHDDELDEIFFQLLATAVESAQGSGREDEAERLTQLRNRLLPLASWSTSRGITAQVLDQQQARMALIERFLSTDQAEWPNLAKENDKDLDYFFFQILSAMAEGVEEDAARTLYELRECLLELTSLGGQVKAGQEAVEDLQSAAEAAGGLTREVLLERILLQTDSAAIESLALVGAPLIDYSFFISMADRIEAEIKAGNKAEADRISGLREKLVALTERWEKTRQARVAQVNQQIDTLIEKDEMQSAVETLLPQIDEGFLSVLAGRIDASRRLGDEEKTADLQRLLDHIVSLIQENAPPEIKLVNQLLEVPDRDTLAKVIESRHQEVTPEVIKIMEEMVVEMESAGRKQIADRLRQIIQIAGQVGE